MTAATVTRPTATVAQPSAPSGSATDYRSNSAHYHRKIVDRSPARSRRRYQNVRRNFVLPNLWMTVSATIALLYSSTVQAALLQGCNFDETLCEAPEVCIPDGLFGQCYSDSESEVLKPLVVDGPLDPLAQELLRLELRRLAAADLNWPHARAQCTLAYFKFSVVYGLPYDPQFCDVRNPNNVWALIQEVQTVLVSESEAREDLLRDALQRNGLLDADGPRADEPDETDGAAEAPTDTFPALLVDENEAPAAAEESQLRPTAADAADGNGNGNGSDVFDAAIGQLQAAEKEKRVSPNGQMAIDLAENGMAPAADVDEFELLSRLPPGLLVDANALAQTLQADAAAAADVPLPQLSAGEEKQLDDYVTDMLNNRRADPSALNDSQLEKLVAFINSVKVMLQQKAAQLQQQAASESSAPEIEEVIPLTSESNEKQLLLKKDSEKFNNADMGLSNTVHKIVKGGLQRVEGNRVYLKVNEHGAPLNEQQLTRLVDYLDRKIAAPNDLFFDAFAYESGQLSFRVSRVKFLPALQRLFENLSLDEMAAAEEESDRPDAAAGGEDGEKEREAHATPGAADPQANSDAAKKGDAAQLDSVSGVAQAVYKRRKDIETLADVEVDETGIGSGVDILPVSGGSTRRDWFFASATAICAVALVVVASFLAMQLVRARRASGDLKKSVSGADLPEVIDYIEGKPAAVYEDLCRQRMSGESGIVEVAGTSRPYDESNLDISTGHVILGFLRDCLEKPDEISNQWSQLAGYQNTAGEKRIADQPENADKNLDGTVVPYDDSVVMVSLSTQFRTRSRPSSNEGSDGGQVGSPTAAAVGERKYLNASRIYDADPRQPAYVAAQAPLASTAAEFWQAVWQENIKVIVNLTAWNEVGGDGVNAPVQYWKSNLYGALEVNLVSEHSFNQDYVVRSIYLKNLNLNETRTVTQLHYVSWENGGLPRSIESLLDFRRKVNKSCNVGPVLVHCSNGAGRTGAYILTDMVVKRILKGVKELNIAASLEHLRDQRMSFIDNEAQYKLVFRCVAEEVSVLLKHLQH